MDLIERVLMQVPLHLPLSPANDEQLPTRLLCISTTQPDDEQQHQHENTSTLKKPSIAMAGFLLAATLYSNPFYLNSLFVGGRWRMT